MKDFLSAAPKIKRLGVNVLGVDPSLSDMDGARAAIDALEKLFFGTLGLNSRLSDLGRRAGLLSLLLGL